MKKEEVSMRVKQFIDSHIDREKAEFDTRLVLETQYKIKGVKSKDLQEFAKVLVEDGVDFSKLPFTSHEEILLAGFYIAYSKKKPAEKIKDIKKLLKYIDNFSTCDTIVSKLKGLEKYKDFFVELLQSDNPFNVRFGIVWLMKYCLKKDVPGVVGIINEKARNLSYYVEMAIIWCYLEALVCDYEYMIEFLKNSQRYVIRNAVLKRACESSRFSPERKTEIRAIRSKLLGIKI